MRKPKNLILVLIGSLLVCQPVQAARFNPFGLFAPALPPTLAEGVKNFDRGDFNGAIQALETYAKRYPNDSEAYYWLAKCYEMTVQPVKTTEALQQYRETKEQEALIFSFAKAPESSKVYAIQVKTEPDRAKCRALLAIALLTEKDLAGAQAEAEKLLLLPDTDANKSIRQPMLVVMADVYSAKKKFDEAKQMIQEAMTIRGNHVLLRQRLESIQALEEEFTPSDVEKRVEAQFNEMYKLAKDLLLEGNLRGALDAAKQAVELKPDHSGARNVKQTISRLLSQDLFKEGKAAFDKQNYEGAIASLQQAIELDPENSAAQELLKTTQAAQAAALAPATGSVEATGSVPASGSLPVLPTGKSDVPALPSVPGSEGPLPE
ncbi:MAG: tetratricopeptide repeat protein [Bacteroidota bacterium]